MGRYEIRRATSASPIAASTKAMISPNWVGGRRKPSVSSDDPLVMIASPMGSPKAQKISAKPSAINTSHQAGSRTREIGP